MLKMIPYSSFFWIVLMMLSACSAAIPKEEDLSGSVLFMGVREDPDVDIPEKPFEAYASDLFMRDSRSASLLWGASLKGRQDRESLSPACNTVVCEEREAGSLNLGHLLDIHLTKNRAGTVFMTVSIWDVHPQKLVRTVSRKFRANDRVAFEVLPSAMNELLSTKGMYLALRDMQPESAPARSIIHLIARGQIERAILIGKSAFENPKIPHTPSLYAAYFQSLVIAGQPSVAISLGNKAISENKVTPELIVGLRQLEIDFGHPGRSRGVLYAGLSKLPDSKTLWSYVIEDQVWRNHPREALRLANSYLAHHSGKSIPSRMVGAIFAAYVFSNQGEKADQWNLTHKNDIYPMDATDLVRHAILFRLIQQGKLPEVIQKARKWILEGSRQEDLYQDLMIAEGGLNEPIDEARTARHAISAGVSNSWILKRLSDLSARGY